ncbi:ubiquinone/menaquinone biosynthesis methyltransferase [Natroniella acetigena]|uniref:ubiquinone/menaquinone biosynthesis methyltransferase n=1 Tax=Natroniella acetigena TaxID=52004 RepID=UPI00200B0FFE|nr:ubiquinone/menaquinone biosynthesis methyltransferase [Natroniella acetigena]MCK8826187.1 ubiquinone/menaquinone biosynthesis methyltransferase [Natroniella acetigena]
MDKKDNELGTKGKYVRDVFSKLAPKYELVNKIISFGLISRWRKKLVKIVDPSADDLILDLCAGNGKLTKILAEKTPEGKVIGVDFCPEMIAKADENLKEKHLKRVEFRLGDATSLDFPANYFDCVTIAFGLRNTEDIPQVIREMRRVVKPGGQILCLDLAKSRIPIYKSLFYAYFNYILPLIGKLVSGQKEPYLYFAESLRAFPNQEKLRQMFIENDLKNVEYFEFAGGAVAVHRGIK